MSASVIVTPWPESNPPTEKRIRAKLAEEGLNPYRWDNDAFDTYAAHSHPFHKVIYVIQGSITFGLPEYNEARELHAGDRLNLPANVRHDAMVGAHGVICLEAHR